MIFVSSTTLTQSSSGQNNERVIVCIGRYAHALVMYVRSYIRTTESSFFGYVGSSASSIAAFFSNQRLILYVQCG